MKSKRHGERGPRKRPCVSRPRVLAIAICAAALPLLAGCGSGGAAAPALPASTAGVQGYVREMVTGRAVAGALVTVSQVSATTDADGRFGLVGVPIGPQAITVEAIGYSLYSDTIEVSAGVITVPDIILADDPPPPPPPS
jgi:hypothetical protein